MYIVTMVWCRNLEMNISNELFANKDDMLVYLADYSDEYINLILNGEVISEDGGKSWIKVQKFGFKGV